MENIDKGIQDFEDFLKRLAEEKPTVRRFVPNEKRVQEARISYSGLKQTLEDSKCTFQMQFKQDELSPASGHIMIEASELRFDTLRWLSRTLELADNVDIYPLKNGAVRMTVGFHGLLDMLPKGEE